MGETNEAERGTGDARDELRAVLASGDASALERAVYELPAAEAARALAQMPVEDQARLMERLTPDAGAFLLRALSDTQAGGVLAVLPARHAASLVNRLPSDEQADLIGALDASQADAVIALMAPEEARDARFLTRYEPTSAGGLMVTEHLAFPASMTARELLEHLQRHADDYGGYDVQYIYVVDAGQRLRGVVRMRDLVMRATNARLEDIMIREPAFVRVDTDLDALAAFFERHGFFGAPVLEHDDRLVGVVRRSAVEHALGERADRTLLRSRGIVGGEELRTMAFRSRLLGRLLFLLPNIGLNLFAVSVIALFEPVLAQATALAIFLPLVSDMGGNAGIQAIAVSMRELALGLIRVGDAWRVFASEAALGLVAGVVLGAVVAVIAWGMRPEYGWALGAILAVAMTLNNGVAVVVGGTLPLALKRLRMDPALASGPALTTVTDFVGFFLVLGLAGGALELGILPATPG